MMAFKMLVLIYGFLLYLVLIRFSIPKRIQKHSEKVFSQKCNAHNMSKLCELYFYCIHLLDITARFIHEVMIL